MAMPLVASSGLASASRGHDLPLLSPGALPLSPPVSMTAGAVAAPYSVAVRLRKKGKNLRAKLFAGSRCKMRREQDFSYTGLAN